MTLVMEAINSLSTLYRVAYEHPDLRDEFIEFLNEIFNEGLGTAYGVKGFTQYQKDALKEILFGDDEVNVLLWSRQVGKTTMLSVFALLYVFTQYPKSVEVLVIAPTLRQSGNLFDRITTALDIFANYYRAVKPTRTGYDPELVKTKTRTLIEFAWGSAIRCLPSKNVRGFSPSLILIDESAFMPEVSWQEILPMMKAKKTAKMKLILTSTPFGTTGRFYEFWMKSKQGYPFHITYKDCPFADKEGIERELSEGIMSQEEWRREYLAEFVPSAGSAIPEDLIMKAIDDYETFSDRELGVAGY